MLEFVLNTSTNVFCQYCPRREGLGRGAVVKQSAKLPGGRQLPLWTGRGQLNETVMFGELSFFFFFFRSVHG